MFTTGARTGSRSPFSAPLRTSSEASGATAAAVGGGRSSASDGGRPCIVSDSAGTAGGDAGVGRTLNGAVQPLRGADAPARRDGGGSAARHRSA